MFSKISRKFASVNEDLRRKNLPLMKRKYRSTPTNERNEKRNPILEYLQRATPPNSTARGTYQSGEAEGFNEEARDRAAEEREGEARAVEDEIS